MTIFGFKKGNYIPIVHENLINNFIFVNNRNLKMMKRLLVSLLITFISFVTVAQNDTTKVIISNDIPSLSTKDSLILREMYNLILQANKSALPRYKIYSTDNIYNLIKLDTATGQVWQVQYRTNSTESMVIAIDDDSLLWSWEDEIPGRYELYPTKNIYNFILLDTVKGYTYQVQWNINGSDYRFRVRIY